VRAIKPTRFFENLTTHTGEANASLLCVLCNKQMKYIIQVKTKDKTNYLQNIPTYKGVQRYWLFEEYKRNSTEFETIEEATKTIGELLAKWSYTTYTIYEVGAICKAGETKATEKTYYPIKEISVSDYN
jgi:hypothetical protein